METDIHLIAETRNERGEWELIPGPIVGCWNCKGAGVYTLATHSHARPEWLAENLGQPCESCTREYEDFGSGPERNDHYVGPGKARGEWYGDRNYGVFGMLANVRNGSGFAGCDLGDPVIPIAMPRDFPADLSVDAKWWFDRHGGDHTETWLSLDEIEVYDWDGPMVHRGVVHPDEFVTFQRNGAPVSWCGGISGPRVIHISNEEMAAGIVAGRISADPDRDYDGPTYVTHVQWTTSKRDVASDFLARMVELRALVGTRDARLVFNFDS